MVQKKILIVEDESIVAADIQMTLENLGYHVVSPSVSGEDALQQAEHLKPDLVLMDIKLKGQMNGIDAAQEMRTRFDIPVVFLTSYADDVTLERVIASQPFGYVLKPYGVRDLQTSIELALYKHRLDRVLKKNESTLRNVIDRAGVGIVVTDRGGKIRISNPAVRQMLGLSSRELLNHPLLQYVHPEASSLYQEQSASLWNGESDSFRLETRLVHKDGRTVWAKLSANLMDEIDTGPGSVVIMVDDITSRVEAEEAYHKLIDQSPLGIILIQDEKIIFANPKICELSGYSCEELMAMTAAQTQELIHPDDRERVVKGHRNRMGGKPAETLYEYRVIKKDQDVRWMSISIGQTNYQGRPAVLAFYTDVHKRKQLEEMLRRGKEEWEATVDAVLDIIILADTHDEILRCNRSAASYFALDFDDIIGRQISDILPRTVKLQGELKDLEGRHYIEELTGWFHIASFPMKINHSLTGTVYLLKDITHEKEIEAALFANQRLTSLGTLAAGLAHEMNSPLQVITSVSESLLKQIDKGENIDHQRLKKYMEMVNRNAWRNADIVRALRLYASSPVMDIDEVDINLVINDTLPLLEKRNLTLQINIVTHLEPDLPRLFCSRENLSVVLVNLITNAIESMPDGGDIDIFTYFDQKNQQIVLQIKDQGSGIEEDMQTRIFDPFFTTKPVGSGPGLGLSTTLGIIKSCGGEIGLESKLDQGTTFTIYIPANHGKQADPPFSESGRYEL